jgi:long-subunit fatty acid transport protein
MHGESFDEREKSFASGSTVQSGLNLSLIHRIIMNARKIQPATGETKLKARASHFKPKTLFAVACLCAAPVAIRAQATWLPGSDPANIARSGAGVAFGRSLEACSLNPALLVTVQGSNSAYLSTGLELQSTQLTMPSNERQLFSTDRNRFMPALGGHWQYTKRLAFGFKLDTPYMRHLELPLESESRFFGRAFDLKSVRSEMQVAYAITDAVSVGLSVGATRLDYASAVSLRAPVPVEISRPGGADNSVEALLEITARQEGGVTVPTFAVGFRYAITSRWTFGGSFTSGAKGTPSLAASMSPEVILYNTKGLLNDPYPLLGAKENAELLMESHLSAQPGAGDISMPYKIQAGLRHRLNQATTWELDLRYIGASSARVPAQAELTTPTAISGRVATLDRDYKFRDSLALSAMIEITLNRDWTARAGLSYDPEAREEQEIEAMLGGAKSAGFSLGLARRFFGGELSAGYQYRQAQDVIANSICGNWSASGLRYSGTPAKVEGMGHLLSIGFKKSF